MGKPIFEPVDFASELFIYLFVCDTILSTDFFLIAPVLIKSETEYQQKWHPPWAGTLRYAPKTLTSFGVMTYAYCFWQSVQITTKHPQKMATLVGDGNTRETTKTEQLSTDIVGMECRPSWSNFQKAAKLYTAMEWDEAVKKGLSFGVDSIVVADTSVFLKLVDCNTSKSWRVRECGMIG